MKHLRYLLAFFLLAQSACLALPAWAAPPVVPGSQQTVRFLIQPPQEAQLASQMSGMLQRYLVKDGATFRRGDRLVEFDCAERRAILDKARATQLRAEKNEASQKRLFALKATSDLEYETAVADHTVARADVAMAQTQVNQCVITAPYAGRVVRRLANQHEHMTVGTPLMQIVEAGKLRIDLLVPSVWLRWLKPGQEFTARVEELGSDFRARVTGVGARVDPASQTIAVRAEFVGDTAVLLPGMSGTADFGKH